MFFLLPNVCTSVPRVLLNQQPLGHLHRQFSLSGWPGMCGTCTAFHEGRSKVERAEVVVL